MSVPIPPGGSSTAPIACSVYQISTGQIVGSLLHSNCVTNVGSNLGILVGAYDPTSYYVVSTSGTPTATARPAMGLVQSATAISANGTATANITNVPNGAVLTIDKGTSNEVDQGAITDGEVAFSASVVGTYSLLFQLFPYFDTTLTVVAS